MANNILSKEIPTRKDLWEPTLRAIASQGGTASYQQIRKLVTSELGLSRPLPDQFWNNLHWASRDLKKHGLVEFLGNGEWALTEEGHDHICKTLPPDIKQQIRENLKNRTRRIPGAEVCRMSSWIFRPVRSNGFAKEL